MTDAGREKVREEARQAQAEYETAAAKIAEVRKARRAKFQAAHDAGFTLREIAEAVGLHNTTVGEILQGD